MYERGFREPDNILDFWHPWEKAQFIDYFETREKRKAEYVDYYENSILAKGVRDTSNDRYPSENPATEALAPK